MRFSFSSFVEYMTFLLNPETGADGNIQARVVYGLISFHFRLEFGGSLYQESDLPPFSLGNPIYHVKSTSGIVKMI